MAALLSKSTSVAHLLRKSASSPSVESFFFTRKCSNPVFPPRFLCEILGGGGLSEMGRGFLDNTAARLAFRRSESTRVAGERVDYSSEEDVFGGHEGDENEGMDFPGGRVNFTSQMKFLSESTHKRIPCYRLLDDNGFLLTGSKFDQVDKEKGVKMYELMVTLEIMDTFFYEAQRQGRISFYMTSIGEEAVSIATAAALSSHDIVLPQYREPGILLWRGFTLQEFANQLFGTKDDHGKARQMPVHFTSKNHNFFPVSSPIATQLPQAAGAAYSLKMDKKDACVVAFIGDGGTSEGDFHAGLNFAAVMDAPVMFICRNNGWAISTPVSEQFRSDGIVVKGPAYGIRSIRVDGNDALAVHNAIRAAREMVITEQKPILVEAMTYRVGHHSTSDDSTRYRSLNEINDWGRGRNPMAKYRKWIERKGWWNDETETELRGRMKKEVLNAIQVADRMEKPCLAELFSDVYDSIPSNLYEQEKSLRETIKRHALDFPTNFPL